jgi:type I restriction enzyme M protein
MLDTDTKRRIDTARDILVGKVPDPKSQVEQITIALIYKFMDDMDAEAEEMGGKRKFFAGEFARYGWAKLMRSGLGGHETLNLYAEGIARIPENPGIPLLFRDIFKNASLPYRDPETLRMFLKIIDEFEYDHSERLGDAYEYLVSILGTQGKLGQLRTPRHIIDFIVEVIDPKKNETVLDPACGTAGFLIFSYKHILRANADAKGNSILTPDEKGRLARNLNGYDIDPGMVRLSLVNMYLHGFTDPHISEYDTLTSQEKWNEYADVILANPPFMSPKGGIKPHKRFSIQSKRSEVLFVDYMAEHLTPIGRAGIIVPEGIIFQSGSAYKQLRKMLVEQYLVAVVSLPAGVFNPYSGVKTSILILDKSLAKKTSNIAFFKIENDGFGLGAQRRAIEKNDLPQAQAELGEYLHRLRAGDLAGGFQPPPGLIVEKEKIAAKGEYNLSGERYGQRTRLLHAKWPIVALGEICTFMTGGTPTSTMAEYYENGTVPWLVSGDIHKMEIRECEKRITEKGAENSNARSLPRDSVLIALNGQGKTRGTVALLRMEGATCNQSLVAITTAQPSRAISEFIFWILRSMYSDIRALTGDNERSGLNIPILRKIEIPLPPLEMQKEIVSEIEGYQRVINGARVVLDNYRPHITIHPDWPMEPIAVLFDTRSGTTPSRSNHDYFKNGTIPWVKTLDLTDGPIRVTDEKITQLALDETHLSILPVGTVLIAMYGGFNQIGRTGVLEIEATHNQAMTALLPTPRVSPYYLNAILSASKDYWKSVANSTRKDPNITKSDVLGFKLPLPSLDTQQAIVAEIEAEQALIAANRELITHFEKKIQTTLVRVWGEDRKPTVEV